MDILNHLNFKDGNESKVSVRGFHDVATGNSHRINGDTNPLNSNPSLNLEPLKVYGICAQSNPKFPTPGFPNNPFHRQNPVKEFLGTRLNKDNELEVTYRVTKNPGSDPTKDDYFFREYYHVVGGALEWKETKQGTYVPPKSSSYEF